MNNIKTLGLSALFICSAATAPNSLASDQDTPQRVSARSPYMAQSYSFEQKGLTQNELQDLLQAHYYLRKIAYDAQYNHYLLPPYEHLMQGRSVRDFVEKMDPEQDYTINDLMPWALDEANQMLKSLDPHSEVLLNDDAKLLSGYLDGEFFGYGIEFEAHKNGIIIKDLHDGPIIKAGLSVGDIITHINGQNLTKMDFTDIGNLFDISENAHIDLTYKSGVNEDAKYVSVSPDTITPLTVLTHQIDNDNALIRIKYFSRDTYTDFNAAIGALNKKGLKNIMLDLRNNPGGYSADIYKMVDDITAHQARLGILTYASKGALHETYFEGHEDSATDAKISVLINNSTRSSAEILAGALQDTKLVKVFGDSTSFGKASFQSNIMENTPHGSYMVSITRGVYFHPIRGSHQYHGVTPDIQTPKQFELDPDGVNYERDYANPLLAEFEGPNPYTPSEYCTPDLNQPQPPSLTNDLGLICAYQYMNNGPQPEKPSI